MKNTEKIKTKKDESKNYVEIRNAVIGKKSEKDREGKLLAKK